MTYLALARKWRPKTFAEVVGQQHVVKALSNALDSGRVHHAFLFTGTRGVGKTTLARIFAKSLNCEEGISAEPCQKCSTCLSIDEGRYVDLIEVDAASRTRVDDTRELLDNIQYAPTQGKYKVYLIDEVHMLSGHSFNALLKTLEEPPEHVKFLFATTDPQKLPVTVLSRCLQFNLRAMRPEQIENQFVKILDNESIEYDSQALQLLANAADGSMRDGLSLLDQSIAQGAGKVMKDDVSAMLGTLKSEHSEALLAGLVAQDASKIMSTVVDMAEHATDFVSALDELLQCLYNISLQQVAPEAAAKSENNELIQKLAAELSPELVQLYYQISLLGKRDINLAPSTRVGFEMTLLRMLAFDLDDQNHSQSVTSPAPAASPTPEVSSAQAPANSDQSAINHKPETQPAAQPTHSQAAIPQAQPKPEVVAPEPAQTSATEPTNSAEAVALAGNNEWGELIEQTQLDGMDKQLAMNCACERLTDEKIELALAPALKHLFIPGRQQNIQSSVQSVTNKNTVIEITVEPSDKETPAECLQRLGFEHIQKTKSAIENDPGVKSLMNEFGATINEQSIKPN